MPIERRLTALSIAVSLAITSAALRAQEADAEAASTATEEPTETVIVTGTRTSGLDEFTSSSPVQVLSTAEIQAAGRPDLMNSLANVVPSFTAQAFGGDMANQTLQAKLRGLSPNHTLVLVNGKRRHTTSSLAILGGPYQGGAGVDLNFIPVESIERIEVLTEGAAAQYGTDAIGGVINIIQKKNSEGGGAGVTYGGYNAGDGETAAFSGNIGFEATAGSYLSLTGEYRKHAHSIRSDVDPRVVDPARIDPDEGGTFPNTNMPDAPGYPYLNRIFGDAEYEMYLASLNAGVPIGETAEVYSTLTWGEKYAGSYENYRLPSRVSYTNPDTGEVTYLFPYGFNPREETAETDYQGTLGVKGDIGTWTWDFSSTYGQDEIDMFTRDSANASLYANTGATPFNFYDGTYTQTQWTTNADIGTEFDVGLAAPLNLAFGIEYREETWEAGPGDEGSRYLEGGQSFPGISLSDSGKHGRDVMGVYTELTVEPVDALRLTFAGRYEDYSDFGDTTVGKFAARYAFTESFSMRGTFSTGFRAPTLAESYYSATNVGPTTAFVQMPPNAPATALLGLGAGLQPEESTNYSVGFVIRPADTMSLTFDVYQVDIDDRIAATSTFYGTIDGELYSQSIVDAIIANGNVLDPEVTASGDTGINLFTNGVNTRTRGADLSFSYLSNFESLDIEWNLAATYTETDVTGVRDTPPELGTQPLFDLEALSDLQDTMPKYVVNLGAVFQWSALTLSVRELVYGESSDYDNDGGQTNGEIMFYKNEIAVTPITNLELSWQAMEAMTLTVGATNVFDEYPDKRNSTYRAIQFASGDNGVVAGYPSFSPFGINGAYWYGKMVYRF